MSDKNLTQSNTIDASPNDLLDNDPAILDCIKSNPKFLSIETQKVLVQVMTDFATELIKSKFANAEIERVWLFVRKIFKEYGIE